MQTDQSSPPPPGEQNTFGYASNVAFVEPESTQKSAGKTLVTIIVTAVVCVFLLAVVSIFALRVLGTTVSSGFSEIEQSSTAAPPALALRDEAFVDANNLYEIQLGTSWIKMDESDAPTGTDAWSVMVDGQAAAAVFATAGPSIVSSYDDLLIGTMNGLREALPQDAVIDGMVHNETGNSYASVSTSFRDADGIEVSTYQIIRISEGVVAVATLSGPANGFDALKSNIEPALQSLKVLG